MAKLKLRARNICGAASHFLMVAHPKPDDELGPDVGLVIRFVARPKSTQDAIIKLHSIDLASGQLREIWPGEEFEIEGEFDDTDCGEVIWSVPLEYANRFELLEFRWRDKPIVDVPGLV